MSVPTEPHDSAGASDRAGQQPAMRGTSESFPEFLERHRELWAAQGLPPHVTDGPTLDAIAAIVCHQRRSRKEQGGRRRDGWNRSRRAA
jgi:hypothetical protein